MNMEMSVILGHEKTKIQNEVTYLYISGITTKPKQSECDVNSYNKDTIAICTCEGPDLMKQLIFQGYGVFICTKC